MLTCTKCSRANPAQATYCYFDGVALSAGGGRQSLVFSTPFAFPGGVVCRDFDQLALACQRNWPTAVDLLKRGELLHFLQMQGRVDLAQAASAAARYPDRDRGLDQFLAQLPSQALPPPRLRVTPTDVSLGVLRLGEDRRVELQLENQGMRLLFGAITVIDTPWLAVGAQPGSRQKLFQFGGDLILPVQVLGRRLRASNKPLPGKLLIDSNGGSMTVTLRAEVPILPYPTGVLAGARSPRQIAEKARLKPQEAAGDFEKGRVAQWYQDNGWTYPVRGPAASGLAAVQQFYEALGLAPPPRVAVRDHQVQLAGQPGQTASHTLEVFAEEKRPVFAHAVSDQPWLEVGRASLHGRFARIPLRVARVPDRPGETLHAQVVVTANGNQRFVVPVTLRVGAALRFIAPASVQARPVVARPGSTWQLKKLQLLPALLLAVACLLVVLWDLIREPTVIEGEGIGTEKPALVRSQPATRPHVKTMELFVGVQFSPEKSRPGISCMRLYDPIRPEERKRLTRDANGVSNNICLRVDGYEYLFGSETAAARWVRDHGRLMKEAPIPSGIYGDQVPLDRGWRSIMHYEQQRITVIQDVEIVVGVTGLYDTVLISYLVLNEDHNPHTVGLRFLLDTYIGANDGVPIHFPPHGQPLQPGGFVQGLKVFPQKDVPEFLQAVEKGDLTAVDSTVAVLGLRLAERFELPEKVVVCRWPQNSEARWGGTDRPGDWQYQPIDANPHAPDSCVAIYWGELRMAPRSQRKMGFTYGLGRIAGIEPEAERIASGQKGQLRLFAQMPRKGKPFTVTAYVRTTEAGEKVTLLPPAGVRLVPGQLAEQLVPPPSSAGYAAVCWQVVAERAGKYELKARVESIGTASLRVVVPDGLYY